ncbi:MAG TPA: penicillin-binding transpeptidase domain-containing protein [Acidimicrobiales bacterium]|nr:penicillin-binding transpeptidase domain-containing protein [Acidimicrobiales bacterium]
MRGSQRIRRGVGAGVAVVVVALVFGMVFVLQRRHRDQARDDAAHAAAEAFAVAWQDGDLGEAPLVDPTTAVARYEETVAGLGGVNPERVHVTTLVRSGDEALATLDVAWPFGNGWAYSSTLTLVGNLDDPGGGTWSAVVDPSVVHPQLAKDDRLAAERTEGDRGEILGRDGTPLVTERPVVEVGVQPSRAGDIDALMGKLADILAIDVNAVGDRVRAAPPDAFVPVITLRRSHYDEIRDEIRPLPGTSFRESTLPLAPTREFARALLGSVGSVTAEMVEASDGRLVAGDTVGLSGLQEEYDEHLGGTRGVRVTRVPVEGEPEDLWVVAPTDGADLALTLDAAIQQAADDALAGSTAGNGNAALVAMDPSTGDIVAVANTPATGENRALNGRYPPGSTFKAVSTLAFLDRGLTPAETVPCPATATVAGRSFRNVDGFALGPVPFSEDFAQSCNTAFVGLSSRLVPGDLTKAGVSVGLGGDWSIGAATFNGEVPVEKSPVELAAATIGQGRVVASPLAMAQVAATIAVGGWKVPRLVMEPAPAAAGGATPEPDTEGLRTVGELMRLVATEGSASTMADVPGEPVHAKTGTAEYGTEVPPRTHAWVIGFQGNIAFAVLIEDGTSGSGAAVPVAEAFLRGLP